MAFKTSFESHFNFHLTCLNIKSLNFLRELCNDYRNNKRKPLLKAFGFLFNDESARVLIVPPDFWIDPKKAIASPKH